MELLVLKYINLLEFLSVTFSLIFFIVGVKQKSITWPINIFMTFFNLIIYHQAGLYHRWIMMVVTVITSLYGWYKWLYGGKGHTELKVSKISSKESLILFLIGILGTIIIYLFLKEIYSANPILSAIRTSFTFIGLWLTAKKKLESYILWFILNIISVYIFYTQGLYLFTIKFLIYLYLSIYGYQSWEKSYKNMIKK